MVDYREILRLRSLGNNITQIANAVHSSRHTVIEVKGRISMRKRHAFTGMESEVDSHGQ